MVIRASCKENERGRLGRGARGFGIGGLSEMEMVDKVLSVGEIFLLDPEILMREGELPADPILDVGTAGSSTMFHTDDVNNGKFPIRVDGTGV